MSDEFVNPHRQTPVWTFAGGKGGVGKSLTALHVATYHALTGHEVVLVDGDLGAPNLHTLLNIKRPRKNLSSFVTRQVETLDETLVETSVRGLHLIAGAQDVFGAANPRSAQKERLLRHLKALPCHVVILDLGGGTSFHVLDLFLGSSCKLVVLAPEPTAIQNAYDFIRMALYRELLSHLGRADAPSSSVRDLLVEALEGGPETRVKSVGELAERLVWVSTEATETLNELVRGFRVHVIVNMAAEREARRLSDALAQVCHQALGVEIVYAGHICEDSEIARSVRRMRPYLNDNLGGDRWKEVAEIIRRVEAFEPPAAELQEAESKGEAPGASEPETCGDFHEDAPTPSPSPETAEEGRPCAPRAAPEVDAEEQCTSEMLDRLEDAPWGEGEKPVVMAVGRNEDVAVGGNVYHVQTEDLGVDHEHVRTVVYSAGRMIHTRKTPYESFRERYGAGMTPQEMVEVLHRAVVSAVKKGGLRRRAEEPHGSTPGGAPPTVPPHQDKGASCEG